jgi:succinyl-CoA synthetase beta subunit
VNNEAMNTDPVTVIDDLLAQAADGAFAHATVADYAETVVVVLRRKPAPVNVVVNVVGSVVDRESAADAIVKSLNDANERARARIFRRQ